MLFEDEVDDPGTTRRFRRPGSFASNASFPTTGKHRGVKLLATVDYETGHIVWQEDEHYTAVLSFAKVMATYPTGNWLWFWTMPGFIMQAASAVSGSAKKSAELVYLPPYSPQLNIVEGLWKWLKSECDQ
ncbi:transposase [Paenibacillus larvae]|nr:transposase [Paenibacillus larvae]MDT2274165.1 transposase [Paenibacillus larvae]